MCSAGDKVATAKIIGRATSLLQEDLTLTLTVTLTSLLREDPPRGRGRGRARARARARAEAVELGLVRAAKLSSSAVAATEERSAPAGAG